MVLRTGWSWLRPPLAISRASLSQRIPKPERISAQGKQGWVPTTPGTVLPAGTGAGAHSSQAEKEKEVELQAGEVCDIRATAEFILPTSVSMLFSLDCFGDCGKVQMLCNGRTGNAGHCQLWCQESFISFPAMSSVSTCFTSCYHRRHHR